VVDQDDVAEEQDLEARVAQLERQVVALVAAIDAASRLRLATRADGEPRVAGGKAVRRILEKSGLVRG
jgi:hypothetical protein